MTRYAYAERIALVDLMAQVGPDAPTLCGSWTTRRLAAHLVLRERRPDAALGIVARRFAGRTEAVQDRIAAGDYAELLAKVRNPPWWSPVSNPLVHETVNLTEMFIHHEDVRRAGADWQPRTLTDGGYAGALWRQAQRQAKLSLRSYRATVLLDAPGHGRSRAGAGGEVLTVSGEPGELLLFLSGRQAHSRAVVEGPQPAAERLTRARLGV
jgi:uncharacterized protein (TIGR03085 family)